MRLVARILRLAVCVAGAALISTAARAEERVAIDADYPGGNIVVEKVEGDAVRLKQDLRDTSGWWFYWNFRVRGAAGRTLTFHFTNGNPIGVLGPAVSTDGGATWGWLDKKAVSGASFKYEFAPDAGEVRFCFSIPYQDADLQRFLKQHSGSPHLKVEPHSTTRKGRATERVFAGKLDGEPKYRVLLTARHHACEMIASYSLEGILAAVLADTSDGAWLRENVEILAVPFMDKDGVEDGDQGKNRKPHDHNRDYIDQSIYPSVIALKELVPRWSQGKLRLALDMHCPYIRGGGDGTGSNERIYFVGGPVESQWKELVKFSQMLERVQQGPLVYSARHNLPWGQKWNTTQSGLARSSRSWAQKVEGVRMATTIEIPYAHTGGPVAVSAEAARALGHDLASAIRRYLEEIE